ncbi:hypothetical protein ACIQMR_22030 [Streptomyces sp. NPDC091376]|uniref:hypothetical protein n=1 Tax=Streptomyces sp. NPDC091376 TaxID=3365994 RepID=UPI003821857B
MPTPLARPQTGSVPMAAGLTWDAVRVPRNVGLTALSILGSGSGAVLEDPSALALYWFIPAGAGADWAITNTRALGAGSFVVIPPRRRTQGPGPHWRICPGEGAWKTDPNALKAAIEDALDSARGRARAV